MSPEDDAQRVRRAALEVAALIKPLVGTKAGDMDWSSQFVVGFVTTVVGMLFRIKLSPLADGEMTEALAIAWENVTETPWSGKFEQLLTRHGDEFEQGADNAVGFVKAVHLEGKEQDAAALWRDVFAARGTD